jgi:hypothetical protein
MRTLLAFLVVVSLCAAAYADKPRILVLPLPPSSAIDAGIARTFDARLLVALDDTKRVITVTPSDEPECTTMQCLADLGTANNAGFVLSMTVVREGEGLTLFGTLIDSKTATPARRVELPRVEASTLPRAAPAELVPQIVGAAPGPTVLGVARATSGATQTLAATMTDRLTELRAFKVVPADGADRSALTHRADFAIGQLTIDTPRRHLCNFLDGTLIGTFSITELATGRVVFTKTVTITASRRAAFSSQNKVIDLLLAGAVDDWMTAFEASGVAARLRPPAR